MAAVLLDTTVLIDLLRGRPQTAARLRALRKSGDTVHACAVNIEETVRGLLTNETDAARRLFAGLRIVPLREVEGWTAGEWRRDYAKRGQTLTQADCLIAAASVAIGGRLATGNAKHFPFRGLVVEEWPAGV
jgi:predicted nucleic acid-binding protein